ncbi:MAG TPA: radical SAM/SPASM domain-containing protein [Verrucomicrobiae bacterium]|jgi:sulfatase maturation enzyme AslB (radical SAM superfamily)|nr:radical SAM/SPASM domain-containing protein [Verrucomicrobiae bacterium]
MPEDITKLTRLLILEVTSHCNMHCTFCPSDDLVRKKGHVSDEQAIQLIRVAHELAPGIPIMFNVLGEPFLNPKLFNYIALCEKENVPVALITNITLLTPERLRKLFQYSNISLNMSLHTPTDKSFAERGYRKIANFREYMEMVCNAIQEKFRQRSKASIEIYMASELIENLMQNDAGSRLWKVFDDPKEYEAGWQFCAECFTALGAQLTAEYPEEFAQGMERVRHDLAPQIAAREIVLRAEDLPEWRLENEKSGWMCAPGVVVRRKGFGMWAYHEKFVQRHAQPGRFVFHEERTEPFKCIGALTFGILADGTYTLCCQDVEGEMDIGNIASLDPRTAFHSPRRAEIIENCATSRICRRCAGNTMILDTFALREDTQPIDKFGFGWHGVEQRLFGVGGRWTSGNAKSYFYTRLEAESLQIRFRSPFHSATKFQLLVSAYDPTTKKFGLEMTEEFYGEKDRMVELEVPARLRRNSFYQLAILSPTYSPQEMHGSPDRRRLGLAVASMRLRGRPYENLADGNSALNFAGGPAAASNAPAHQFPILA